MCNGFSQIKECLLEKYQKAIPRIESNQREWFRMHAKQSALQYLVLVKK